MTKDLLKTIFNGIAVVVLNIVNPLTLANATTLLGIAGLKKEKPGTYHCQYHIRVTRLFEEVS